MSIITSRINREENTARTHHGDAVNVPESSFLESAHQLFQLFDEICRVPAALRGPYQSRRHPRQTKTVAVVVDHEAASVIPPSHATDGRLHGLPQGSHFQERSFRLLMGERGESRNHDRQVDLKKTVQRLWCANVCRQAAIRVYIEALATLERAQKLLEDANARLWQRVRT